MAGGSETFKVETVWNETHKRRDRVMVAVCGKCGRRAHIADTSGQARSVAFFADKFRRKCWRIASHRRDDQCPACVGGIKPKTDRDLTPAQKRAAFCRIADVPRAASATIKPEQPKGEVMPKTPAVPVSGRVATLAIVDGLGAEPPRQPTREDKRKIREALDACYLIDKARYAGDGNDKTLAERLNVPRAWVAAERDDAYGPDACEDDGKADAVLADLIARQRKGETEALDLAARFEASRREAEALRAKLAKRGVA